MTKKTEDIKEMYKSKCYEAHCNQNQSAISTMAKKLFNLIAAVYVPMHI